MRRALVVCRILLVTCVAAILFPTVGRGLYGQELCQTISRLKETPRR